MPVVRCAEFSASQKQRRKTQTLIDANGIEFSVRPIGHRKKAAVPKLLEFFLILRGKKEDRDENKKDNRQEYNEERFIGQKRVLLSSVRVYLPPLLQT